MSGATLFVLITVVIHCIGIPVMIWAVRGDQGLRGMLDWFPEDEDGGGGSKLPEAPDAGGPGGGAPLPDSERPRRRLREHGDRLADPRRRPHRRHRTPARPTPQRTPAGPRR